MSRRNAVKWPGLLGAMLLLVLTLTACGAGSKDTTQTGEYSFYTKGQHGGKIYGYEIEEDGSWYLFVPAGQSLEELTIHYDGDLSGTSHGEIDTKKQVIQLKDVETNQPITLETAEGERYTLSVMQSDLPSVEIYLSGTTLEEVHADKDTKHPNNSFILDAPEDDYDLDVRDSVEFKGRGNSTWALYDKKGYQIKFKEATSVMGMGAAKKWVLLANASDDSMLRNQLVYRMADKMDMEFVPSFEYVDLWIDGEYLGTYLLGEKVEPGDSRLALTQQDGSLFEHDESFYNTEDYWLYSEKLQRHFVLKEIVLEEPDAITKTMDAFEAAVDELAEYLYTTPSKEVTLEALASMIDVDSFAKYYLVNEYALNKESYATSFYWYWDGAGDVLHLGPIWDFDTCMGNDSGSYEENYGDQHVLIRYLLAAPVFKERAEELYEQYRDVLHSMTADVRVLEEEIANSAAMNYLRWDVLGKPMGKADSLDFHDSFEEAVDAVENWLGNREEHFRIADCKVVDLAVSEDCRTMEIALDDETPYHTVYFAVRSVALWDDLIIWCAGEQRDGVWYATADLTQFESAGMYHVGVHVNNQEGEELKAICDGWIHVEEAVMSDYRLEAEASEDGDQLIMTLRDTVPCEDVVFAVWSEENGQDDLQWLDAERNAEGLWYFAADLDAFLSDGMFYIHAYEMAADPAVMLDGATVVVE